VLLLGVKPSRFGDERKESLLWNGYIPAQKKDAGAPLRCPWRSRGSYQSALYPRVSTWVKAL